MKFRLIYAAVALLGASPVIAQGFTAENGVGVVPSQNGFMVTDDAGIGARGMWCAAADYARRVSGARSAQRLYVQTARESGRSPVTFSLSNANPSARAVTVVGVSLRSAGANLSVGHAYSFCVDHKLINVGGRP